MSTKFITTAVITATAIAFGSQTFAQQVLDYAPAEMSPLVEVPEALTPVVVIDTVEHRCTVTETLLGAAGAAVIGYYVGAAIGGASLGGKTLAAMPDGMYRELVEDVGDIGNRWVVDKVPDGWKSMGLVRDNQDWMSAGARSTYKRIDGMALGTFSVIATAAVCSTAAGDAIMESVYRDSWAEDEVESVKSEVKSWFK